MVETKKCDASRKLGRFSGVGIVYLVSLWITISPLEGTPPVPSISEDDKYTILHCNHPPVIDISGIPSWYKVVQLSMITSDFDTPPASSRILRGYTPAKEQAPDFPLLIQSLTL